MNQYGPTPSPPWREAPPPEPPCGTKGLLKERPGAGPDSTHTLAGRWGWEGPWGLGRDNGTRPRTAPPHLGQEPDRDTHRPRRRAHKDPGSYQTHTACED